MTRDLTYAEFGDVFERFAQSGTATSVFRWECLQDYKVDFEDSAFRAFREGTPRPERSVRTWPWLARVAATTLAGKAWTRVRYVVEPLSEYTEFEFVAYVESQTAGERILITDRLDASLPDFWLFDGTEQADRRAVLMHYDAEGAPVRFEYRDDAVSLGELADAQRAITEHAAPLNTYLARRRAAHGAA